VVDNIQNISECYCSQELEGCIESMSSELVLQDLAADENQLLKCITAQPGFKAVCLQKWSLPLAADKYRTKGKQKYRQTGFVLQSPPTFFVFFSLVADRHQNME